MGGGLAEGFRERVGIGDWVWGLDEGAFATKARQNCTCRQGGMHGRTYRLLSCCTTFCGMEIRAQVRINL